MGEKETVSEKSPPEDTRRSKRHIHPCICDLTAAQKKQIKEYRKAKEQFLQKYETRIKKIEAEIRKEEEEEREKEREEQEQHELYEDEYELTGYKKKRKKRAPRRASMVSLGVKQVINWHKPPRIQIKYTKTFNLRSENPTYCLQKIYPYSEIVPIDYRKAPKIPGRKTNTFVLRAKVNYEKKESLSKLMESKYPRFQTNCKC